MNVNRSSGRQEQRTSKCKGRIRGGLAAPIGAEVDVVLRATNVLFWEHCHDPITPEVVDDLVVIIDGDVARRMDRLP
jgi:hypothetical protein